eukprot:20376-Hanusia_phi.AAC.1
MTDIAGDCHEADLRRPALSDRDMRYRPRLVSEKRLQFSYTYTKSKLQQSQPTNGIRHSSSTHVAPVPHKG